MWECHTRNDFHYYDLGGGYFADLKKGKNLEKWPCIFGVKCSIFQQTIITFVKSNWKITKKKKKTVHI